MKVSNRSPEEAGDYVRKLQGLLRSVGSSDGNMEQVSVTIAHDPVHGLTGTGLVEM